jgi:hypothetical protein
MFSNNLENINEIFYNYNENTIYKTQYEKIPEKDGYLKIPYLSNIPNLTISTNQSNINYMTTNIYIFKKIHESNYHAELVIEHIPATNGFQKLYTCFFLAPGSRSAIDSLISGEEMTTLNLNNSILPGLKANIYENEGVFYNDIVIVFDKPIYVTSSFDVFTKSPFMFSNNQKKLIDIPCSKQNITISKTVEGMTDIPVFCTPIDEISDATDFTNQIVMPVIGPLSESIQSSQLFGYTMNFITFFIMLIAIYFGAPAFYIKMIVEKVIPTYKPGEKTPADINAKIYSIFWYNLMSFIGYDIMLIAIGYVIFSSTLQYLGVILGIIIFISTLVILQKTDDVYNILGTSPDFVEGLKIWFINQPIGSIVMLITVIIISSITFSLYNSDGSGGIPSIMTATAGIIGFFIGKIFDHPANDTIGEVVNTLS